MNIPPTPPRPSSGKPANSPTPAATVVPSNSAAFQRTYETSRLEDPFAGSPQAGLSSQQYHTSQRAAMNAQLREATEGGISAWITDLAGIQSRAREVCKGLPASAASLRVALEGYEDGYRATDSKEVTLDELTTTLGLITSKPACDELASMPTIDGGTAKITLGELVNATSGLSGQRLTQKKKHLEPLDAYCGKNISTTAAALHERLHVDVMRPIIDELKKQELEMARMERNATMLAESRAQAKAEKRLDQAAALQEQEIAVRSEACLLAVSRMQMLEEYGVDVHAHDDAVKDLLSESKKKGDFFTSKADDILRHIKLDLEKLSETQSNQLQLSGTAQEKYSTEQKQRMKELDTSTQEEAFAWDELNAVLTKLSFASNQRRSLAQSFLNAKEKEDLRQQQFFLEARAINAHVKRLHECEGIATAAAGSAAEYEAFVATMDRLLGQRDVGEELLQIQLAEGKRMLEAFVVFEDVSQALQATKRMRLDLLHQERRQRRLDLEQAITALDPSTEAYKDAITTGEYKITALDGYLKHLKQVVDECEGEARPYIHFLEKHGVKLEDAGKIGEAELTQFDSEGNDSAAAQQDDAPDAASRALEEAVKKNLKATTAKSSSTAATSTAETKIDTRAAAAERALRTEEKQMRLRQSHVHKEQEAVEDELTQIRKLSHENAALQQY